MIHYSGADQDLTTTQVACSGRTTESERNAKVTSLHLPVREQDCSVDSSQVPTIRPALPNRRKVWIDLDNSPHVPFFLPIIEELEKKGYQTVLTARDASQLPTFLHFYHLPYHKARIP